MRDAGVPNAHCHPHVLRRHTFATLYLQRRAHDSSALTKLQALLGHASLETTRGYLHHTRDELERSMRSPERSVLDTAAAARRTRNAARHIRMEKMRLTLVTGAGASTRLGRERDLPMMPGLSRVLYGALEQAAAGLARTIHMTEEMIDERTCI